MVNDKVLKVRTLRKTEIEFPVPQNPYRFDLITNLNFVIASGTVIGQMCVYRSHELDDGPVSSHAHPSRVAH